MMPTTIQAFTGRRDIPTLVLVDPQREFLCEHRPLGLKTAPAAVSNCKRLLECARKEKIPVAFVRWQQETSVFNRSGRFSEWIDGLSPTSSDMVFERHWPSCYKSSEFAEMMRSAGSSRFIIAGFTGSVACLATILDGIPNQHSFVFVEDASASHSHRGKSEIEVQKLTSFFISIFAATMTTDEVLAEISSFKKARLSIKENCHAVR